MIDESATPPAGWEEKKAQKIPKSGRKVDLPIRRTACRLAYLVQLGDLFFDWFCW